MKTSLINHIICILFTTSFAVNSIADDQRDKILGMPFSDFEMSFIETENSITRTLLDSVDSELSKQLVARAGELAPKNPPPKLNYFGFDHMVKDGSIVRLGLDGSSEVLVPGSILPKDAKFGTYRFSPDQKKLAFAYSFFGSDWQTWQIYDLENKKLMTLDGEFTFKGFSWPGISWTPDSMRILVQSDLNIGLDFTGIRKPGIILHQVGTPQTEDKTIFSDLDIEPSSRWGATAISNDKAILYRNQGVAVIPVAAFVVDLNTGSSKPALPPNKYLGQSPGTGVVGIVGSKVYFRTAEVGNNFGIIMVDGMSENPLESRKVIVKADPKKVLYMTLVVGNKILAQYHDYNQNVSFVVYSLEGEKLSEMKPSEFGMTDVGSPGIPLSDADQTSKAAYFSYSSVAHPPVTFKLNAETAKFEKQENSSSINFDSSKVVAQQVKYESFDGRKIDMWLYKRTDQEGMPASFAYLYSYGFIGIPNLPQWNRKFQLALEMGAIVAVPMLRGGGEYGANVQLEGALNREKTFKDLVFASRWLKKNVNIVEKRVVAVGRSFGGLTSAVHYVHHQNEFDLISSIVPVTDWTAHFKNSGWWMGDDFAIERDPVTGKLAKNARHNLIAEIEKWNPMSHVEKLEGKKLIPAIFFTSMFDTNTTPHQSISFVTKVKAVNPGQPIYFFVHPNVGHGGRAELVDELLFIAKQFEITEFSPLKVK